MIVIYFVVGHHDQANANKLGAGIKERPDWQLPFFISDELKHYDNALLEAYGLRYKFPRTGK
jgi:hypothetical protein